MTALPRLTLKPGHVQPVWAGHPWVFAQAVARVDGAPEPGAEVLVCDARGEPLGRALYSPSSAIVARLYTRALERPIDADLFRERIRAAVARRASFGLPSRDTTGLRWVHAEGDGLPGVIVDGLGDVLAVQWGTLGIQQRSATLLDVLESELAPRAIVDRSSARAAKQEGFEPRWGVVRGSLEGASFRFLERGLAFEVPLALGQKTGFYFDQRPLRARVEELSAGRRVLDAYCYVGSIALGAARGGAREVVAVDTSEAAIEVARSLVERNGHGERVRCVHGDALELLSSSEDAFDLVICDPPKLAPRRSAKQPAIDSLRRLARGACRATRDGGLILLSSCSAAVGPLELSRALALGARDVGRRATILERLFQGADHPVPAAFPEGLYLSSVLAECSRD